MKARPILFSGPMVRALLEGRKTQTRRLVKPPMTEWLDNCQGTHVVQDGKVFSHCFYQHMGDCPYGQPGDLLWVREAFSYMHDYDTGQTFDDEHSPIHFWTDGNPDYGDWTKPKPSIHMPRWASRLTLRITDVSVQRLQEISEEDALAEGARAADAAVVFKDGRLIRELSHTNRGAFCVLWESINGAGAWDANPWVWAISFEVIRKNVDAVMKRLTNTSTTGVIP